MTPVEVSELEAWMEIIRILAIAGLGSAVIMWVVAVLLGRIGSLFGVSFPANFK